MGNLHLSRQLNILWAQLKLRIPSPDFLRPLFLPEFTFPLLKLETQPQSAPLSALRMPPGVNRFNFLHILRATHLTRSLTRTQKRAGWEKRYVPGVVQRRDWESCVLREAMAMDCDWRAGQKCLVPWYLAAWCPCQRNFYFPWWLHVKRERKLKHPHLPAAAHNHPLPPTTPHCCRFFMTKGRLQRPPVKTETVKWRGSLHTGRK